MLARARSRLGPKLRAHARARSYSGIQCSYSLGARGFGARPIPSVQMPKIFEGGIKIYFCVFSPL